MKNPAKIGGIILCIIALPLLTLNFVLPPSRISIPPTSPIPEDVFDPLLAHRLQTIDQLLSYTDSIAEAKNIRETSLDYGIELAEVIRYRFYHGYSHYQPGANWLAWLAGTLIWDHLHAIVIPADIMKYPMAACSQQSIVMMECLKRKGIPYRSTQFAHHYALEARLEHGWRFFDTNMEPVFPENEERKALSYYSYFGKLENLYGHKLPPAELATVLKLNGYGDVSGSPAPKAAFFHRVTWLLSRTIWLIPLILGVILLYTGRKRAWRENGWIV